MSDRSRVQEANKKFYEAVAGVYEKVDRRRDDSRDHDWLRRIVANLRERCPGKENPVFLDLGAGTAFLSRLALEKFPRVIATDISPAVLAQITDPRIEKICAPCEELPIEAGTVDVVGAFATLHHLYDPVETFREAYRVLKPGGLLYTDHDIERRFVQIFQWPLRAYRHFFDHGHDYLEKCPQLSTTDYALTEFHGEKGLDGARLVRAVKELGFREVEVTYHWHGLLPFTPFWKLRGFSPLMRIIAKK